MDRSQTRHERSVQFRPRWTWQDSETAIWQRDHGISRDRIVRDIKSNDHDGKMPWRLCPVNKPSCPILVWLGRTVIAEDHSERYDWRRVDMFAIPVTIMIQPYDITDAQVRFLARVYATETEREAAPTGRDAAPWRRVAAALDALGLVTCGSDWVALTVAGHRLAHQMKPRTPGPRNAAVSVGAVAAVLKGAVEGRDGSQYFHSMGGYRVAYADAEHRGWVALGQEEPMPGQASMLWQPTLPTELGLCVYRTARLGMLPTTPKWEAWDWRICDYRALA